MPIEKCILRKINIAIQEKLGVQKIDIVSATFDYKDSFVEVVKGKKIKKESYLNYAFDLIEMLEKSLNRLKYSYFKSKK